jgi:hypothetical protein
MEIKTEEVRQKYSFNWEVIIGLIILMVTILGATVPLYIHSSSQIDAIHLEVMAINQEMKDFHGRLERQDAEFKGRLERQDAEFKGHVLLMEERNKK